MSAVVQLTQRAAAVAAAAAAAAARRDVCHEYRWIGSTASCRFDGKHITQSSPGHARGWLLYKVQS